MKIEFNIGDLVKPSPLMERPHERGSMGIVVKTKRAFTEAEQSILVQWAGSEQYWTTAKRLIKVAASQKEMK